MNELSNKCSNSQVVIDQMNKDVCGVCMYVCLFVCMGVCFSVYIHVDV